MPETATRPVRLKNSHYRSREYLSSSEVNRLLQAASLGKSRQPDRDYALILMLFRHGLRANEASNLKWDAISFDDRSIWVTRSKKGISGSHDLQADEIEALEAVRKRFPNGAYVFQSERGSRLHEDTIASIVERCGIEAEFDVKIHPHMLRHSCGFHLAEQGIPAYDIKSYLGHRNIQSTDRYIAASKHRFKKITWD